MADLNEERVNAISAKYQLAQEALENKFKVDYYLSKAEIKEKQILDKNGSLVKPHKGRSLPEVPNNEKEAFKLFVDFYAAWHCEKEKSMFEEKYKVWNELNMKTTLEKIDKWINSCENVNVSTISDEYGEILNINSAPHEYLRLKTGFYDTYLMTRDQHSLNGSLAAFIYGKCFLFRDFLIEKLKEFVKEDNSKRAEPRAPEIALFCAIVNDSNIITQGVEETNGPYCKRVCKAFNLKYTENVRKAFRQGGPEIKGTNPHFKKVKSLILPTIEDENKRLIQTYIDTKVKLFT